MKRILTATAATLAAILPMGALAADVGGGGTQPYACTVIGNSSLTLVSTGNNQLTASGSGNLSQNGDTTYTISAATVNGPDTNLVDSTTVLGGAVSMTATESLGDTQAITGELDQSVTYTVTLSSSDGTLAAGAYTSVASLTCAATS